MNSKPIAEATVNLKAEQNLEEPWEKYKTVDDCYKFIAARDKSDDYETIIKCYNKAIELGPESGSVFLNRGIYLFENKCYTESFADFTKAIDLFKGEAENISRCVYWRGRAYEKLGNNEQAEKDYNTAIEKGIDNFGPFFSQGLLYLKLQRNEESLRSFGKAIEELEGEEVDLPFFFLGCYYRLALVNINMNNYKLAKENLNKANDFFKNTNQEDINHFIGDLDEIKISQSDILEKLKEVEDKLALGGRERTLNEKEKQPAEIAPELSPEEKDSIQKCTNIYDCLKLINENSTNPDKVNLIEGYLLRGLELKSDNWDVLEGLIKFYRYKKINYEKVIQYSTALIQLSGLGVFPYQNRIWATEKIIEHKILGREIQEGEKKPCHYCLSYKNEDKDDLIEEYNKMHADCDSIIRIGDNTQETLYWFLRGVTEFKLGEYSNAIGNLNKAIKCQKEDTTEKMNHLLTHFYYNRGLLLEKMEKYTEAKKDYELAIAHYSYHDSDNSHQIYYEDYFGLPKSQIEQKLNAVKRVLDRLADGLVEEQRLKETAAKLNEVELHRIKLAKRNREIFSVGFGLFSGLLVSIGVKKLLRSSQLSSIKKASLIGILSLGTFGLSGLGMYDFLEKRDKKKGTKKEEDPKIEPK